MGLIPGSRRSPGEGNGNLLRILAWKIPWIVEPGGLQSKRSPPPKKKERNTAWFLLKSLISFYFCLGSVTTAMHMSIFSPVQFLCILLLKERHVQVQAQQHAVKGSRSQSISLCLSQDHLNLFEYWTLHWYFCGYDCERTSVGAYF